jgi:hypothetical protein
METKQEPKVTAERVNTWRNTGHLYMIIAAEMALWTIGRERGEALPENAAFGRDLARTVSPSTYHKAKRFLSQEGVLYTNDGPYKVALQGSA